MRSFLPRLLTIASLAMSPMVGMCSPVAALTASRTSGPAPLAVFFDATGSTDTITGVDAFRQDGYQFNFGDPNSGTWAFSGLQKNLQTGAPLAAHVFETPGTYTVQVTSMDTAGNTSTASVTITVQNADTVYAGTSTVCLSRTTDFTGCPAGAQQLASVAAWPSFKSSVRYLLHAGQDFTALGGLNYAASGSGVQDGQVGSFGAGAQPTVGNIMIASGSVPGTQWNKRDVIMNLSATSIGQNVGGSDLLIFRNTSSGWVQMAEAFAYYTSNDKVNAYPNPTNIFIVENSINTNFSNGSYGITGNAVGFAILGNNIDQTYYHNVRLWQASKAIIAHNSLSGHLGGSGWHAIKIHAAGLDPVATSTLTVGIGNTQRTSLVTIADNMIGSVNSNVNWQSAFCPQNDQAVEGLENVIIEDNQYRHGSGWVLDLAWAGRYMTDRGNVDVTDGGTAIHLGVGHATSLPAAWNGPYYQGQPSMLQRFNVTAVRPNPPTSLKVQ